MLIALGRQRAPFIGLPPVAMAAIGGVDPRPLLLVQELGWEPIRAPVKACIHV